MNQIDTSRPTTTDATEWWKRSVIYQIYPRSFQDSNGDGIGDLKGIESRLDYLVDLGVDAIWISPFFPSPMADFGYDVSDYCGVDPMFGTLEDFDSLVAAAHARGLRMILDFVPCHSSDRHPWFTESRSSRNNPMRDWYIWRDAKPDGSPPTNWIGEFGGSTWTWDEATGQYYLHIFLPEQPSLNWRNAELRTAMLDAMRFWYDRGVDGFRVDAIPHAMPNPEGGDHPENPAWQESMGPAFRHLMVHSAHQPEVLEIVRDMRRLNDSYPGRVLIGETGGPLKDVLPYYGEKLDAFHLPFYFAMLRMPWDAETVASIVEEYEDALPEGAWPTLVLGNHDISRIASRVGPEQARVAAALLLTLRGTPVLYQGDELGMDNAVIPPEAVQDPWEKRVPGLGLGRDPARSPMPWEPGPGAGFSTGTPWLPLQAPPGGNAEAQSEDPASMLGFVRDLISLRRAEPALSEGSYRTMLCDDGVYCFERTTGSDRIVVCLNFSGQERAVPVGGVILLSSQAGRSRALVQNLVVLPNEAIVLSP